MSVYLPVKVRVGYVSVSKTNELVKNIAACEISDDEEEDEVEDDEADDGSCPFNSLLSVVSKIHVSFSKKINCTFSYL